MFWNRLHIQDVASQIHIDLFYFFLNKGVFGFCWCTYIKYFTFWVNICVLSLLELSKVLGHRLSQFSYVLNKKSIFSYLCLHFCTIYVFDTHCLSYTVFQIHLSFIVISLVLYWCIVSEKIWLRLKQVCWEIVAFLYIIKYFNF